ncbi:hypothetical protein HMPREF1705_04610 [Acetomicrobium hydrogeniformans ATCC BAA-1850]|uniref:Uncharacterized protein n=1 Tax=Acetomicrobium hydrogeniformans ATCC BAA-1850 TaxID=592015 RepID=A0A0T5X836_9BACT|nr:hypothetical protein HMPREF1705_04610 [Acetomicrobium hydrogeniformans ATCC BAA-1850]
MFHEVAVSNLLSKFKNVITIYKHNIALHQLYYSTVDKPVKVFVFLDKKHYGHAASWAYMAVVCNF